MDSMGVSGAYSYPSSRKSSTAKVETSKAEWSPSGNRGFVTRSSRSWARTLRPGAGVCTPASPM
jgi:hypothetical protein